MQGLTTFQYDIMAVLYREGLEHGLGVKSELEKYEKYGGEVNHGRLYPNLDELSDRGYVKKSEWDGRTNEYELSNSGRVALRKRVRQLGGEPQ